MRPRRSSRLGLFAWLLAALAVFGQIAAAVARPEMEAAPLGIICGVDRPAPSHLPLHQHHDCAACPLCAAAAVHAAVLTPAPVPPEPGTRGVAMPGLPPPARAPPSWRFQQPFPRGPPAFA